VTALSIIVVIALVLANGFNVAFAEAMQCRERLVPFSAARFVFGDFRSTDWPNLVQGPFECVVSMQAIHEVRHKRHVPRLYKQVLGVAGASGLVLICDHTPKYDSWRETSLFMTEKEQLQALSGVSFVDVKIAMAIKGLVLYACRKAD
jgi:hypothetical protein